jgi:hypothetical protein
MRYWICGDKFLVMNAKVGSSSLARAVIAAHHPSIEHMLVTAAYPPGRSHANGQWQTFIPYKTRPHGEVVCMVRDPVERFRSAMAQVMLTDVAATLDELENENRTHPEYRGRQLLTENVHFLPQTPVLGAPVHYLRFPDQLNVAADILELAWPLPVINEQSQEKPVLTHEQVVRVREFYAADVAVYGSL